MLTKQRHTFRHQANIFGIEWNAVVEIDVATANMYVYQLTANETSLLMV